MKLTRILLILAALSLPVFGQTTTYSGVIKDLSGAVVTSGNVTFTLTPSIDTTISGISRFVPSTVTCGISGTGTVLALDLVNPCVVTQNTALTPTGTSYKVCIQPYFTSPGSCFIDFAVTSSKDITTVAPTPALSPSYNYITQSALASASVAHATTATSATSATTATTATTATKSGTPDKGFSNAKTDCGVTGDGTTIDDIAGCAAATPAKRIFLPKLRSTACTGGTSGGGCLGSIDYKINTPIVLGDGQTLECETAAGWPNGGVRIVGDPTKPMVILAGVSSKIKGCILDQQQYWNFTVRNEFPQYTSTASLNGVGPDTILAVGGEFIVEQTAAYGCARHCLFIAGHSAVTPVYGGYSGQPDGFYINGFVGYSGRGWGIFSDGQDANAGTAVNVKTWANILGGVDDNSWLGSTWIGLMSHLDNREAMSAGANGSVTSIQRVSNVTTYTGTAVASAALNTYVTCSGTTNFNRTMYVTSFTSTSNFGMADTGSNIGPDVAGTCHESSTTEIYALWRAIFKLGAFAGADGSSTQAWIHPYCESNSNYPMPGAIATILAYHGCDLNLPAGVATTGVWLKGTNSQFYMLTPQGAQLHNPTDGGNAILQIKSGTSSTGSRGIDLMKNDGTIDFRFRSLTGSQVMLDCGTLGAGIQLVKTQWAIINPCTMSQDVRFMYNNGAVTGKVNWWNDTTKTAELDPAIGRMSPALEGTLTNCSSTGGTCAAAAAGSVGIAAAGTTVTVATTAVTASSQIFIQEDSSLGTKLGVTCNTTTGRAYTVTTRTAGTSFVITSSAAPVTNPACLSYFIVN